MKRICECCGKPIGHTNYSFSISKPGIYISRDVCSDICFKILLNETGIKTDIDESSHSLPEIQDAMDVSQVIQSVVEARKKSRQARCFSTAALVLSVVALIIRIVTTL